MPSQYRRYKNTHTVHPVRLLKFSLFFLFPRFKNQENRTNAPRISRRTSQPSFSLATFPNVAKKRHGGDFGESSKPKMVSPISGSYHPSPAAGSRSSCCRQSPVRRILRKGCCRDPVYRWRSCRTR
jgi:hypothetical protein